MYEGGTDQIQGSLAGHGRRSQPCFYSSGGEAANPEPVHFSSLGCVAVMSFWTPLMLVAKGWSSL